MAVEDSVSGADSSSTSLFKDKVLVATPTTTTTPTPATPTTPSRTTTTAINNNTMKNKKKKKKRSSCNVGLVVFGLCLVASFVNFVRSIPKVQLQPSAASSNHQVLHWLNQFAASSNASRRAVMSQEAQQQQQSPTTTTSMGNQLPLRVPQHLIQVWKHMIEEWNVHSVLEMCDTNKQRTFLSCEVASVWFQHHGVTAMTHMQLQNQKKQHHSLLTSFDVLWAPTLTNHSSAWDSTRTTKRTRIRSAAILVLSFPSEDQPQIQQLGFQYSANLTTSIRSVASGGGMDDEDDDLPYYVYLNPAIIHTAKHAQLFRGPVHLTPDMDQAFEEAQQQQILPQSNGKQQWRARPPLAAPPKRRPSPRPNPWQIPIPEPIVPDGFTNVSFWNMIVQQNQERKKFRPADLLSRIDQNNLPQMSSSSGTIPVVHWPTIDHGFHTAEHLHMAYNGILSSPFLTLVTNLSTSLDQDWVWIAEPGFGWDWNQFCHEGTKAIQHALIQRYHVNPSSTYFPVYIMDFSDGYGKLRCLELEQLLPVIYLARSLIGQRRFRPEKGWVLVGQILDNFPTTFDKNLTNGTMITRVRYRHIPLAVRTDVVQTLQNVLQADTKDLSDPLEAFIRPVDVAHYWPAQIPEGNSAPVNKQGGRLRLTVSRLLERYGRELNWTAHIGLSGTALRPGRRIAQTDYVQAMLQTKIVVVTQRDDWEDHYRLMEALVSGAMVMSDQMLAMPKGLHNGTSIVFFTSRHDLRSLIVHYLKHETERLAVARKGREIAMSQHRSWHRMEEVVFGRAVTTCQVLSAHLPKCPYIVHTTKNASLYSNPVMI